MEEIFHDCVLLFNSKTPFHAWTVLKGKKERHVSDTQSSARKCWNVNLSRLSWIHLLFFCDWNLFLNETFFLWKLALNFALIRFVTSVTRRHHFSHIFTDDMIAKSCLLQRQLLPILRSDLERKTLEGIKGTSLGWQDVISRVKSLQESETMSLANSSSSFSQVLVSGVLSLDISSLDSGSLFNFIYLITKPVSATWQPCRYNMSVWQYSSWRTE